MNVGGEHDEAAPGRRRHRPVGRRPGNPDQTKDAILAAARQIFGSVGFDRATVRAIAAGAEVDPALVIHHFGSKQMLFVQANELPFEPSELLGAVIAAPAHERGTLLARFYLEAVGAPGSPALSLLRAATSNDDAARMMREFVTDALLAHASTLAPGPDSMLRVALAAGHLIGVIFGREVIGLPVLRDATIDELVALSAPAIQFHLDGPGTGGRDG